MRSPAPYVCDVHVFSPVWSRDLCNFLSSDARDMLYIRWCRVCRLLRRIPYRRAEMQDSWHPVYQFVCNKLEQCLHKTRLTTAGRSKALFQTQEKHYKSHVCEARGGKAEPFPFENSQNCRARKLNKRGQSMLKPTKVSARKIGTRDFFENSCSLPPGFAQSNNFSRKKKPI
jgi:hypothetical protein